MLKSIYRNNFVTTLSLFVSLSCYSQTDFDKTKIYNAVIATITDKTITIVNQTIASIDNFDIDSSYNKYNDETNKYQKEDYKPTKIHIVCVNRILHYRSLSISGYLQSKKIVADTSKLFEQVKNRKADSLSKYVSNDMLYTLKSKRGILSRVIGSLRLNHVKTFVIVSDILFSSKNEIAFVKLQIFPKKNLSVGYTDKIIFLNKIGEQWVIKDTLE